MEKARIIEHKARKLIGEKVRITCKRHPQPFPGFNFMPYSFTATLEAVERNSLQIKKDTGMTYHIRIKDEYMMVEEITPETKG